MSYKCSVAGFWRKIGVPKPLGTILVIIQCGLAVWSGRWHWWAPIVIVAVSLGLGLIGYDTANPEEEEKELTQEEIDAKAEKARAKALAKQIKKDAKDKAKSEKQAAKAKKIADRQAKRDARRNQ